MDYHLLFNWLGLTPGPWPPDHYTLLGLAPGAGDTRDIEPLVLSRMERLRAHQLRHPELATEGMNRLAQALICLSDPVARANYDADLGLERTVDVAPRLPEPRGDRNADTPPRVEDDVESRAYRLFRETTEARVLPEDSVLDAELIAPPVHPWQPARPRDLFARLAQVRRLLSAWEKLKPVLGDPTETVDRPATTLVFRLGLNEIRPVIGSLPEVFGERGRPGGLVAAILVQPGVLETIRRLALDQRKALAIDWRRGEQALHEEHFRLRELARIRRQEHRRLRRRRHTRKILRWIVQTPELLLIPLAAALAVRLWMLWRRPM